MNSEEMKKKEEQNDAEFKIEIKTLDKNSNNSNIYSFIKKHSTVIILAAAIIPIILGLATFIHIPKKSAYKKPSKQVNNAVLDASVHIYLHDYGDYQKAKYWLEKAVKDEYGLNRSDLDDILEKDPKAGLFHVLQVANQEFAVLNFNMALMHLNIKSSKHDYKEEKRLLEESARRGLEHAKYNLAAMYFNGNGTEKDHQKAFFWFEEAAQQEFGPAQYYLALMSLNGDGTERDYYKAFYWMKKAAEQENIDAKSKLGLMYYKGIGTEKDYQKAFDLLEKAAIHEIGFAQYNLAVMYLNGDNVEQDDQKAFFG